MANDDGLIVLTTAETDSETWWKIFRSNDDYNPDTHYKALRARDGEYLDIVLVPITATGGETEGTVDGQ